MKITVKSMTPYKFVVQSQRPWAQKAQDIGSWYDILYTVGVAAVLFNAFSLVFTSSFMDKQVYKSSDHVNQTYWDFVYTTANATMYFPNFECDPDVMASRNWTTQDECLPEFCYYRVRTGFIRYVSQRSSSEISVKLFLIWTYENKFDLKRESYVNF